MFSFPFKWGFLINQMATGIVSKTNQGSFPFLLDGRLASFSFQLEPKVSIPLYLYFRSAMCHAIIRFVVKSYYGIAPIIVRPVVRSWLKFRHDRVAIVTQSGLTMGNPPTFCEVIKKVIFTLHSCCNLIIPDKRDRASS